MNNLFEEGNSLNIPIECFKYYASEKNFPIKPHWHYFAELIYMLGGKAKMQAGDDTFILEKGDFIFFHPSEVHSIFACGSKFPEYAVIKFDINRLSLTSAYAPKLRDIFRYARRKKMKIAFKSSEAEKLECEKIFSACLSEMTEYRYGRDIVLQAEIYKLLMNIIRLWISRGFSIDSKEIPVEDDFSIENITEYIDISLGEDIKVNEIAKHCNLSYSCFAKKFRSQYGMSCKQYIEKMRIHKAEEFLLFTDRDLNYISQETGFSDCSHLIKCFKKHRGVTPKQYRMSIK